ncbi:hypothetical protein NMY22_g11039 [Coprinellus aureogranulatus]|nr:hypothetical protein NMY22_g11039 [Coprinellus aureogranulatus]
MSVVFGLLPEEPSSLLSWIMKSESLAGGLPPDIEELRNRLSDFVVAQKLGATCDEAVSHTQLETVWWGGNGHADTSMLDVHMDDVTTVRESTPGSIFGMSDDVTLRGSTPGSVLGDKWSSVSSGYSTPNADRRSLSPYHPPRSSIPPSSPIGNTSLDDPFENSYDVGDKFHSQQVDHGLDEDAAVYAWYNDRQRSDFSRYAGLSCFAGTGSAANPSGGSDSSSSGGAQSALASTGGSENCSSGHRGGGRCGGVGW